MKTEDMVSLATLAAVGVGVYMLARELPGMVSGNNAITRSATNAAGQPVSAYEGAGVLGTLGAATNAASGGLLASAGQWLGGLAFDLNEAFRGGAPGQRTESVQPVAGAIRTTGDLARYDRAVEAAQQRAGTGFDSTTQEADWTDWQDQWPPGA